MPVHYSIAKFSKYSIFGDMRSLLLDVGAYPIFVRFLLMGFYLPNRFHYDFNKVIITWMRIYNQMTTEL